MPSARKYPESSGKKPTRRAPASTPEERENNLISLATRLAEKQMREDRASSQVISHYLKLGSSREALEQERLKNENELLRKKIQSLESASRVEALYEGAIDAMRNYGGRGSPFGDQEEL